MKKGGKKMNDRVSSEPCSKCFLRLLIIGLVLFLLQGWFVFAHPFNDSHYILGNLLIVLLASVALVSSFKIYKAMPSNFPREKNGKLFLLIAVFLFFLGDVFWLINEIINNMFVPIGGTPDILWILAYFSLIISIIYFISTSFRPSKMTTILILVFGFIIGGTILGMDIAEDFEEGSFTLSHSIQDSYIFFDLIVLILIVYLVGPVVFSDRRYIWNWLVLAIGLVIRLVYDLIFANMSQEGTYYTGHPVDFIYTSFYIILLISFYIKSRQLGVKND